MPKGQVKKTEVRKRKCNTSRAGTPISGQEFRDVCDLVLLGYNEDEIAEKLGRTADGAFFILDKIYNNYDERGKRTPPLEKMEGCPSCLDYDREPTKYDIKWYRKMRNSRRKNSEIKFTLHINQRSFLMCVSEYQKSSMPPETRPGLKKRD